jgi:hypothetical protein
MQEGDSGSLEDGVKEVLAKTYLLPVLWNLAISYLYIHKPKNLSCTLLRHLFLSFFRSACFKASR